MRQASKAVGILSTSTIVSTPSEAIATNNNKNSPSEQAKDRFISSGYNRKEYTNSITASRDTNISPAEVYDTLGRVSRASGGTRALDVGCGAGVSTQTLFDMGFTTIDACDWSSDAWDANVVQCPESVHFYALDDERFLKQWRATKGEQYDAIVFNFAINQRKAVQFATELLRKDGVLLAPVNEKEDYWLKQTYELRDSNGELLWSASDVGAWSVQFQPDVTQDTCQGIWCPPFNGFRKQQ
jgi:2-polyprenyl-3-methyl-5-hydroxy-6-metoxy-1,4-benzoquinol methylase